MTVESFEPAVLTVCVCVCSYIVLTLSAFRFLNVGPHQNKNRLPLASMDENAMDTNMHELLDLCSGQFASQNKPQPNSYSSRKQNMEDLLNLCSGKFASQGEFYS